MSDAIIYQSPLDPGTKQSVQQISDLKLTGLRTTADGANTNGGKLYGSFIQSGSTFILNLYSDITKIDLVASATHSSSLPAVVTVAAENDSGLTGTVNFIQYLSDDTAIEIIALLTVDADIPLTNLTSLNDYDPDKGFAFFHEEAFSKIKEVVTSRYRSKLFNRTWVDTRQINGGLGGFDLSRILNWDALKEAASHYVLYRIAERQTFDAGSIFAKKSEQSRNIYKAFLERTEMVFDEGNERTPTSSRSLSTWKIARGG